ncbi:ATP-binding protein [Rugosimonospora acidiphila]
MLTPVSTLLCRVKRRLPVAVVDLYGTFDDSSAVSGVISLRERLADQPMALVLDVTHLSMAGDSAPLALLKLADDAAAWPGARLALCGAGPGMRALLEDARTRRQRYGATRASGDQRPLGEPRPLGEQRSVGEQRPIGEQRSAAEGTAGERAVGERAVGEQRMPVDRTTPVDRGGLPNRGAIGEQRPMGEQRPIGEQRTAADRDGERLVVGGGAGIDLFDRVEDAVRVALRAPVPPRHSVRLPPDRHAPEQARLTVDRSCAEWGVSRLSQLAQVIVSELVTNAVVHARTPMELTVRLVGKVLHLAVRDGDPRSLVDPGGGVDADGHGYGRGLLIVDSMSDGWGCAPTGEGKVVWARLAVPA